MDNRVFRAELKKQYGFLQADEWPGLEASIEKNAKKIIGLLPDDAELTESEWRSLLWFCQWEHETVDNMVSIFKKMKGEQNGKA